MSEIPSSSTCQAVPPPPPPTNFPSTSSLNIHGKFRPSLCDYSPPDPVTEVRDACRALLRDGRGTGGTTDSENSTPKLLCHYQQVAPIIQDGPKCGLVALCMASQLLCREPLNVDEVYQHCLHKKYTLQGEMFSAADMCATATALCGCPTELLTDLKSCQGELVEQLMRGHPILFPYDADRNHGPACRKGHAAHWAVLTGVVLVCDEVGENVKQEYYHKDSENDDLYHVKCCTQVPALQDLSVQKIYVCTRQGKSKHMRLWSLSDMLNSNWQLEEVGPELSCDLEKYVLPPGGMSEHLADKAVCLNR